MLMFILVVVLILIIYTRKENTYVNEYFLNQKNTTEITHDVIYISKNEYDKIKNTIYNIIINKILELANTCKFMNGDEKLITDTMTFTCLLNDPEYIHLEINKDIEKYIFLIKTEHNIQLTSSIIHDINLLDTVIYPLINTNKYTMYGNTYFTYNILYNQVFDNVELENSINKLFMKNNILQV